MQKPLTVLKGDIYGRLTVLREDDPHVTFGSKRTRKIRKFVCECSCGNKKSILLSNLRNGSCTSCGCAQREQLSDRRTSHGLSRHALYGVHRGMMRRCYDPNNSRYADYGGRGIIVCAEWRNLSKFFEWGIKEWKPGLQLERRNNNKGYSPSNCYWATPTQQSRNRRDTVRIKFRGSTVPLRDVYDILKDEGRVQISYDTVRSRYSRGYRLSECFYRRLGSPR